MVTMIDSHEIHLDCSTVFLNTGNLKMGFNGDAEAIIFRISEKYIVRLLVGNVCQIPKLRITNSDVFTPQALLGNTDLTLVKRYARIVQADSVSALKKAGPRSALINHD